MLRSGNFPLALLSALELGHERSGVRRKCGHTIYWKGLKTMNPAVAGTTVDLDQNLPAHYFPHR